MLKKIISLMLVVCMMFTMANTVSAADSAITEVVSDVASDGTFTVTYYVTTAAEDALQGYKITADYDKSKIAVDDTWTKEDVFKTFTTMSIPGMGNMTVELQLPGTTEYNTATDGKVVAVWNNAGGYNSTIVEADNGLYKLCTLKFKILEDGYGSSTTITYSLFDTMLKSDLSASLDKVPDSTEVTLTDIREPITGLAATTVDGKVYTGEAYKAEDLIDINTETDDDVTYEPAEITNAGEYEITATVARKGFKKTEVKGTAKIAKKAIEVTMADKTMTYGDALPEFTHDAPDGVTITPTVAENPNAGPVAITATAKDTTGNYEVTVKAGTLTVAKKAIEVTMADKTMTYGDALPEFTHNAPDGVTITPTVEANPNAGPVAITATANDTTGNYDVTVKAGTLTVKPLAVKMIVKDVKQPKLVNKMTEPEISWEPALVGDDEIEVVTAVKDAEGNKVEDFSVVGAYKVVATVEGEYKNYAIEAKEVEADYEIIETIPVYIKLTGNAKEYDGAAITDADVKFEIVEADKYSKENVKVSVVEPDKNAGKYEIKYELVEGGDVTKLTHSVMLADDSDVAEYVITPKKATITIADAEKLVDAADPEEFKFATEGFLEGEEATEINIIREAGEAVGKYAITTDYKDANYDIDVVNGVLEIKIRKVKVTAPSDDVNLNDTVPELKATVAGDALEGALTITIEIYDAEGNKVETVDTTKEAKYTTKAVVVFDAAKYEVETVDGVLEVEEASGRPSGAGSVIRPATGGSTGGSTTKPEDDKKDEENKDDETGKPAASANIALKEDAKEVKFIEGFEDKTFRPDVNATRNEVVSALTALFDISDVKNAPAFTDTDDKAIKELAAAGVINGYEDGSFKGHNDVTRAEFVKLVAAALKLEAAEDATANFSDIDGHWAAEFIKTFVGKGYLVGYPDGTFKPEAKITRAEMVVVMTRVVGSVADADAVVNYADIDDSHWAYEYIKKAAK